MHQVDTGTNSPLVKGTPMPTLNQTYNEAYRLLLSCAAEVFHCKASEVTQEQVLDPHTEYMFYLSVGRRNRTMLATARDICKRLDERDDHFRGKYTKIVHPLVKVHADRFKRKPSQYSSAIYCGMQLLEYLCELPDFRLRKPYDLPIGLIQRHHLLKFRQHLLNRVQKGAISAETAKRDLGRAVAFIKDVQNVQATALQMNFTGITIRHSENRPRRLPNHSVIEDIISHLATNKDKHRGTILFILLACATGARPGELLQLTPADIDPGEHAVWLKSKTNQGRWVPLPDRLWAYLWAQARGQTAKEQILRNASGKPLKYNSLATRIWAIRDRIDGSGVFRHLFATDCMIENVPIDITTYVMGHASPDALTRYQRSEQRFARQEVHRAFESWGDPE